VEVTVYDIQGNEAGTVELDESVFGVTPNVPVMHQALVRQRANARQGTHSTKTRAEVRGGGRKPWRQKGTGRARQGSIRSPQWRGGGVVFGPKPRKYTKSMPKKMRRLAIRSVLSAKHRDAEMIVVDGVYDIEPKTRAMRELLARLPLGDARSTLIVVGEKSDNVYRGANNLERTKVLPAEYINMQDMLSHQRVLVTRDAIDVIHRLWAQQ
jgi:large subunit ribosomal protein L4